MKAKTTLLKENLIPLTDNLVKILRRRARQWPRYHLKHYAETINVDPDIAVPAIRGHTYKHLDSEVAPFKG